jgi:hypothetical protein
MDKCSICQKVAEYKVSQVSVADMQVETIQVTGAATASGNITMTITSANMTGSPLAVVIAIVDLDAVGVVASKIAAALELKVAIKEIFTVSVATDTVTLTEVDDGTLGFGFVDTDTTGVTCGASTSAADASAPLLAAAVDFCLPHMINAVTKNNQSFNTTKRIYTREKEIMSGTDGYINPDDDA